MKLVKLLLKPKFRSSVFELIDSVGDASEDGKMSAAERKRIMSAMWGVIRAYRG